MAASKDPSAYPVALRLLIDHFTDPMSNPVETHFTSFKEAERTRFTFYNYKRALRLTGDKDFRAAGAIIAIVAPDGSGGATLTFSLRDNVDFALDLEAAILRAKGDTPPHLNQAPPSPREETSDEAVARYLEP